MKEATDALGRRVVFNPDTKRAIIVAMFGIGCYEYDEAGGNATANHRGIVGTDEDATEWLNGGAPKLLQIYKNGKPL